jgi:cold shock CspA family protein
LQFPQLDPNMSMMTAMQGLVGMPGMCGMPGMVGMAGIPTGMHGFAPIPGLAGGMGGMAAPVGMMPGMACMGGMAGMAGIPGMPGMGMMTPMMGPMNAMGGVSMMGSMMGTMNSCAAASMGGNMCGLGAMGAGASAMNSSMTSTPVAASGGSPMDISKLKEQESAFLKSASETLRGAISGQSVRSLGSGVSATPPPGSGVARSNPMHRAYQPEGTEPVHSITDHRFEGHIRMFLEDVGYGFIKSASFEKAWESTGRAKNDVFIHRYQKGPFHVGDRVSFSVYLNFKGKPQGTDLRIVEQAA